MTTALNRSVLNMQKAEVVQLRSFSPQVRGVSAFGIEMTDRDYELDTKASPDVELWGFRRTDSGGFRL